jgi:hypothetical protein
MNQRKNSRLGEEQRRIEDARGGRTVERKE